MKIAKVVFLILIIVMYAYAFATGIAITHIADDTHECQTCGFTEVAQY